MPDVARRAPLSSLALAAALLLWATPHPGAARVADSDQSFWNSPGLSGPKLLEDVPADARRPCGRYVLYCPGCERSANSPSIAYDATTHSRLAALWLWGGCRTPRGMPREECAALRKAILDACR